MSNEAYGPFVTLPTDFCYDHTCVEGVLPSKNCAWHKVRNSGWWRGAAPFAHPVQIAAPSGWNLHSAHCGQRHQKPQRLQVRNAGGFFFPWERKWRRFVSVVVFIVFHKHLSTVKMGLHKLYLVGGWTVAEWLASHLQQQPQKSSTNCSDDEWFFFHLDLFLSHMLRPRCL